MRDRHAEQNKVISLFQSGSFLADEQREVDDVSIRISRCSEVSAHCKHRGGAWRNRCLAVAVFSTDLGSTVLIAFLSTAVARLPFFYSHQPPPAGSACRHL
jgi:hypothetical protein